MICKICHTEAKKTKSPAWDYNLCYECYRRVYKRFRAALKQNPLAVFSDYVDAKQKNKRIKIKFKKPAKYFNKKLELKHAIATPKWLTHNQIEEIANIYLQCPKGMHVDHIVPVCNKIVCGLNVPWNLQYLTAAENITKGNKFITELLDIPAYRLDFLSMTQRD